MTLEDQSIYLEFLKGQGFPIGTPRTWGGKKYIKVGPGQWKPYTSERAAKMGRMVQEKIRGRKGKRPMSGVTKKAFVFFNPKRSKRTLGNYLTKGKVGTYDPGKGIPKGGKVILVNADGRRVIGEAHTKKGVARITQLAGGPNIHTLAYVPRRGRPSGSSPSTGKQAA